MQRADVVRALQASLVLGCGILLLGCGRANDDRMGNQGSGQSDQESVQGGTSGMNDANIVAKLQTADSMEVAVGRMAVDRATNPKVKNFARMLMNDHRQHEGNIKNLARRENITPAPPANDTSAQHMQNVMNQLKAAGKGKKFDQAFMDLMIKDHQEDIDEAKTMQSNAKNEALKQELNQTIPKLQQHLDHAKQVRDQLTSR